MSSLRTNLNHSYLVALAEMEANHAKHLVYDRAHISDTHTEALAEFYEAQRAAAAERCDKLKEQLDSVPF